MDANTVMLNKKMDEDEKREKALGDFRIECFDDLDEIRRLVNVLKIGVDDYQGYDFTEDLEDMIKEII